MKAWDYKIKPNFRPKTPAEWEWFLVRKINYDDYRGLTKGVVKKYFPKIERQLDPGKREMLKDYLGITNGNTR